jgi:hypothetical protein
VRFAKCFETTREYVNSLLREAVALENFESDARGLRRILREMAPCLWEHQWYWGQTAMTIAQVEGVLQQAIHENPGLHIDVVTQSSTPELDMLARRLPHVRVRAGESPETSLARMLHSDALYIANSYMGFLAGLLRPPSPNQSRVYYPRNAMFAIFGLGGEKDHSGWKAFEIV